MYSKTNGYSILAMAALAVVSAQTWVSAATTTATTGPDAITYNGWYGTSGNRIVESSGANAGTTATFNGINWFGFETANYVVNGLWQVSMNSVLKTLSGLGYNLLRIPYCDTIVQDPNTMPNGISFYGANGPMNQNLQGLTSLQCLDQLVQSAGSYGMKVILDQHRPDASGQSPLWYTNPQYPGSTNTPDLTTAQWVSDLTTLATRYKNNPTVIGFDLHNEPHNPATWGTGNPATDWRLAAEQAGNAIQAVNPHLLIGVEGVQSQSGTTGSAWWGGDLKGVATAPVELNVPNQVIYSPHDYGPEVFNQPWFNAPNYPNNLPAYWNQEWGYISKDNIAPVWVGEFGGPQNDANSSSAELQWINALTSYIKSNNLYWTFWDVNPNSGDTGGLLQNDWTTVDTYKQGILNNIMNTSGPATLQPAVLTSAYLNANTGGELNGQAGGTGWAPGSSWAVNIDTTKVNVVTPTTPMSYQISGGGLMVAHQAVQLTNAMYNPTVISRNLASPQNGNGIFVSFLYSNTADSGGGSTMAAGKQLFVWLGNSNGPRVGINGTGGIGNEFFVQTDANSTAASTGGSIQKGKVYYIVAFLFKSTAVSTGPFDRMALWVNPSSAGLFSPLAVASLGTNTADALTSFQTLGMEAWAMQNGDSNLFSNFLIGNSWATMMAASPVPEPASLALLGAALLSVGLMKRSGKRRRIG